MRIDHITFNNMTTTGIDVVGDAQEVIDHVTMNGASKRGILIQHTTWQGELPASERRVTKNE